MTESPASVSGYLPIEQSDPIPESSLPKGETIFRVVCDQHVNGHGVAGGWYGTVDQARFSIDNWWRGKYPRCQGWHVERRTLSPWESVDD